MSAVSCEEYPSERGATAQALLHIRFTLMKQRVCKMHRSIKSLRTALAHRQQWRCFYCKFLMWSRNAAEFAATYQIPTGLLDRFRCTAEHLTPRTNGGGGTIDNIVAACQFCNETRHRAKVTLSPEEYQRRVQKRVKAGKWHPRSLHHLLAKAQQPTRPIG
ncbi:HNH endonuclease [Mesorhizobium sp. B2-8-9]|nr:HNH endonuclease [Mesorhizobium sp. B2-8-9]